MKFFQIALFSTLTVTAAFGQTTYAQPVRETEKEPYSAAAGFCQLTWGPSSPSTQSCNIIAVPADKILAIRQASISCSGRTGDSFANVFLATALSNSSGYTFSVIPLQTMPTTMPSHQFAKVALTPLFQHGGAGRPAIFSVTFDGQKTAGGPPYCNISVQGYFLPAVQ